MKTALVIDDNQDQADALCHILEHLGLEARPVYGPRGAFLALDRLMPDIIFMDINMPGVDGFEVAAYMRRDPRLEQIPVIFVTSDDQKETLERVRETGALGILIKPVTIEKLEAELRKWDLL